MSAVRGGLLSLAILFRQRFFFYVFFLFRCQRRRNKSLIKVLELTNLSVLIGIKSTTREKVPLKKKIFFVA